MQSVSGGYDSLISQASSSRLRSFSQNVVNLKHAPLPPYIWVFLTVSSVAEGCCIPRASLSFYNLRHTKSLQLLLPKFVLPNNASCTILVMFPLTPKSRPVTFLEQQDIFGHIWLLVMNVVNGKHSLLPP